jgi:hypothetical protein
MHLAVGNSTNVIISMWFVNNGIIKVTTFTEDVQKLNKKKKNLLVICPTLMGEMPQARWGRWLVAFATDVT